jgi:hypothetical protein
VNPVFSICHTSARPDSWRKVYEDWIAKADHPENVEYVLVCDRRWGFHELPARDDPRPHYSFDRDRPADSNGPKAFWNTGRRCYVDGVNIAAQHATGDILIVNADDQFPCEHWDTELCRLRADPYAFTQEVVIRVSTGTAMDEEGRGLMPVPIFSRARYERLGYVFFPGYESMYADNDFYEHAKQNDVIVDARHLMFPHIHPLYKPAEASWDDAYQAQNRPEAYEFGRNLLEIRRATSFGSPMKPKAVSMPRRETIAMCLLGETFHSSWVGHLIGLMEGLKGRFNIGIAFGYNTNIYVGRWQMLNGLLNSPQKADYVLWIDDDNLLSIDHMLRLLKDLEEDPSLDAVAGWCYLERNHKACISAGHFDESGECQFMPREKLLAQPEDVVPVDATGFPAVLMRYSLVERVGEHAFSPRMAKYSQWGFSGEDVSFGFAAKEAGAKIAIDRRVLLPHLKTVNLVPQEVFDSIARSPGNSIKEIA